MKLFSFLALVSDMTKGTAQPQRNIQWTEANPKIVFILGLASVHWIFLLGVCEPMGASLTDVRFRWIYLLSILEIVLYSKLSSSNLCHISYVKSPNTFSHLGAMDYTSFHYKTVFIAWFKHYIGFLVLPRQRNEITSATSGEILHSDRDCRINPLTISVRLWLSGCGRPNFGLIKDFGSFPHY